MKQKIIKHKETCSTCGHITVKGETIEYCDHCSEELSLGSKNIHSTVFFNNNKSTEQMQFCNWGCFLPWILYQKDKMFAQSNFYFVTFPQITSDNIDDFFNAGIPVTVEQLQYLNVRKDTKLS